MTEPNLARSIVSIAADLDRPKLIMEVLGSSAIECRAIIANAMLDRNTSSQIYSEEVLRLFSRVD